MKLVHLFGAICLGCQTALVNAQQPGRPPVSPAQDGSSAKGIPGFDFGALLESFIGKGKDGQAPSLGPLAGFLGGATATGKDGKAGQAPDLGALMGQFLGGAKGKDGQPRPDFGALLGGFLGGAKGKDGQSGFDLGAVVGDLLAKSGKGGGEMPDLGSLIEGFLGKSSNRPRSYAGFQGEIFMKGAFGQKPAVTVDPNKLEEQAKAKLTPQAYGFLAGGSGERATMEANRLAFRQWKLIPRVLTERAPRDLSIELLGKKYPTPIMIAPIGFQYIFHPDAEPGVASIARELGVPYIMSQNSGAPMEKIAEGSGDGERWFQFYWPPSDFMSLNLLCRARANGFRVLVVTLDAFTLGWRPWDLDQGYMPSMQRPNNSMPAGPGMGKGPELAPNSTWSARGGKGFGGKGFGGWNATRGAGWNSTRGATLPPGCNATFDNATMFSASAPSWDRIKWLRQNWPGPILLKGIQHPDDARKAVEVGVDGIIVSNHGGRQLDGGIGSLDALPDIVEAVGDRIAVLFDSGVRTGADVMKALALGAKAVLIGRPWAYGLGVAGKEGAKDVLRGILAQLEINMSIAGIKTIPGINRNVMRRIILPGDRSIAM